MTDTPAIAQKVRERKLTYLSSEKLSNLIKLIDEVIEKGIPGDFAEFGIALGGSAICIASKVKGERRFYGFDNFEMIPPPQEIDGMEPNERYQIIKSGKSRGIQGDTYYGYEKNRYDLVCRNFLEFGFPVDQNHIHLVKGDFQDTLGASLSRPIAFAHLDCDWYASVMCCLEHVNPLLSKGGILLLDDYNNWEGCNKATDEFCASHPELELVRLQKSAYIVKRG